MFEGEPVTPKEAAELARAAEKRRPKFKFIREGENTDSTERNWLVDGFIEQNSLTVIFGDPAAGKSFVALDIALSITAGLSWAMRNTGMGAVFYVSGEGLRGIEQRVQAWKHDRRVEKPLPFFYSTGGADLLDESHIEALWALMDENYDEWPALIVFDTLARNFGAGDENNPKDINKFIRGLDELRTITGAAILVVHHSGHSDKGRARGSSALRGAVDQEFVIRKTKGGRITMECTKMKDAPPADDCHFELIPVGEGAVARRCDKQVMQENDSPRAKLGKDVFMKALADLLSDERVNGVPRKYFHRILVEALRVSGFVESDKPDTLKKTASRICDNLVSDGFMELCREHYRVAGQPGQT